MKIKLIYADKNKTANQLNKLKWNFLMGVWTYLMYSFFLSSNYIPFAVDDIVEKW